MINFRLTGSILCAAGTIPSVIRMRNESSALCTKQKTAPRWVRFFKCGLIWVVIDNDAMLFQCGNTGRYRVAPDINLDEIIAIGQGSQIRDGVIVQKNIVERTQTAKTLDTGNCIIVQVDMLQRVGCVKSGDGCNFIVASIKHRELRKFCQDSDICDCVGRHIQLAEVLAVCQGCDS